METVYRLKPHELTDAFFETIKERFGGREIKITIEESYSEDLSSVEDAASDETEFLLRNEANRKLLLAGVEAAKQGSFSHTLTLDEIEAMAE